MSSNINEPIKSPQILINLNESNVSPSDDDDEEEELCTTTISELSSSLCSHNDSSIIENISKRRETERLEALAGSLRKQKLFPIFGDQKLAEISVNYFLYLEFFHGIIRIFVGLFLFTLLMSFLSWIIPKFVPSEYFKEMHIILSFCNHISILFLFVFLPRREYQRILQEKALYEFQWSEDIFSVLIEGLPNDVTREEISYYLQSLLGLESQIVDIIYLHDYKKYIPLKIKLEKAKKKLKKYNKKGAKQKTKDNLMKKINTLEDIINQMNQEFINMKHFGGKVIVIFDTVWAQNQIIKHFSYGCCKGIIVKCFKSCFPQYYFQNHYLITVKTLPEPRDVNFHNLYYSNCSKRVRRIFARIIGSLLVNISVIAIMQIQNIKSEKHHYLVSWLFSLGILLANIIMEKGYLLLQNLYINRSALEDKLGSFQYYFAMSSYLYNLSQLVSIFLVPHYRENLTSNLLNLMLLFCAKSIILQLVEIYSTTKSLKNLGEKTSNTLVTSLIAKVKAKYIEFNFIIGLSRTLPPLIIGFVLFASSPLVLLPILIVGLYIIAILDKYKIIKICNLFSARSAYFMLKPFWIYNWITLYGFAFTFVRVFLTNPEILLFPNAFLAIFSLSGYGIIFAYCCQTPLDEKFKRKFIELNTNVRYESVSANFSSSFRKKDPYHQNKFSSINTQFNDIL